MTGDLRIIENRQLRELIQKGPNYRESRPVNWKRCREKIKDGLDTCSNKMLVGKDIPGAEMTPWKNELLRKVDERIRSLKLKVKPKKVKQVLK